MSLINSTNYITIQGWMITELNLSGNDLLVYAIIRGFSQDDGSVFSGSIQYLADWCNATTRGIQKNLNRLVERGLIQKNTVYNNGKSFCEYYCTPLEQSSIQKNKVPSSKEQSSYTTEQSSNNNIVYNIDNKKDNISKDILSETESTEKPKKKNLFEKCADTVNEYTDDSELRKVLLDYLTIRLAMKEKPLYGLNQWKGLLNSLSKCKGDKISIVNQSITNGWAKFVDSNDRTYKQSNSYKQWNVFSEGGQVKSVRESEDDLADVSF